MLIWLASYPRSGNHLARMILKQSFGLDTYTIYRDHKQTRQKGIQDLMGEQSFDEPVEEFLERARTSPKLFIVKTHEFVPDGDRAIYIIRDAVLLFTLISALFAISLVLKEPCLN